MSWEAFYESDDIHGYATRWAAANPEHIIDIYIEHADTQRDYDEWVAQSRAEALHAGERW